MGGIFINYRRDETAGEARALFSELSAKLGADSVFMDVDNIAPGRDFRQVLQERLASVDVMLTLIGKDWMRATDAAGRRRLDDTNDFVRREIRAALERNISVTPVLLQGAQMPAESDLPEDIRDLAYRNAFELSHTRWSSDIQELVKRLGLLKREPTDAERSQPASLLEPAAARAASSPVAVGGTSHRGWVGPLAIGMSVLVVAIGGFLYYQHAEEERVKLLLAQAEADKRQAQTEAQLAAAKAEAASAAGAQAQRERERLEREAKELAAEQAAKDRALAEQLAKQQAAEQAAKERAAAEQLAKQRAVEQAAKEQIAQDKAASDQAVREQRARLADQERDRRMAEMRQGKFSGSLTVSLGDYATIQSIAPAELTVKTVMGACDKWSQQVLPNESRNFRAVCLGLPQYANQNGFHLGTRATPQQWMAYCVERANAINAAGDDRNTMMGVCLKYR